MTVCLEAYLSCESSDGLSCCYIPYWYPFWKFYWWQFSVRSQLGRHMWLLLCFFKTQLPWVQSALRVFFFLQDGRINALYSTPSMYTDAKNAANETWPLKTHDYFPWEFSLIVLACCISVWNNHPNPWYISLSFIFYRYADRANAYWTGYFTSRPAFKGYIRMLSGYYLVWTIVSLLRVTLANMTFILTREIYYYTILGIV